MEYIVVEIGGKQYKVSKGDILEVDHLNSPKGSISFEKVLLHVSDGNVKLGRPHLKGAVVTGKVLDQLRGEKIRVARFKAKSRHRRVHGHRQHLTRIQIDRIQTTSA